VSRRPLLLLLLAGSLALAGCAGTDPDAAAESGATATSTATATAVPPSTSASPTTSAGRRIEVQAKVGEVTGDTGRVPVTLGETVTLVVDSVTPDEVHVHGYDLTSPVSPFSPAELTFDATIPGVFEVELHEAGTVLLTLQVQ
jgi:hypothetical protein